jgi:PAS domain S-box-containing protein
LSESEDSYRDLVENSQDLICTHDLEGKILLMNATAVRLTGYSLKDLLGMNMADLLIPEVRHLFKAYLAEIQAKGWSRGTMRIQTACGEPRYWEYFNTLRTKGVKVPIVRALGHDITERERAEEKLRRQAQILDQLHEGIVSTDLKGFIVSWNPGAERLLGYSAEEALGKPISFVFPQDQLSVLKEEIQPQVREKGLHKTEVRFRSKAGKEFVVHLILEAFRDTKGVVVGMIGSAIDITELKRAESQREAALEALRESEDKFRYVFDHSVIGKSITLPSGEINVNKAFCDMLGYSTEELQARKWQELTYPDDIEATHKALDPLLSGEKDSARFEKRYIHKNGPIIWADVSTTLRKDVNGKPLYFMTAVIDISQRKQTEFKLSEQIAELQRWHNITLDRESRILDLKREVNELLGKTGQLPRYPSAEPADKKEK